MLWCRRPNDQRQISCDAFAIELLPVGDGNTSELFDPFLGDQMDKTDREKAAGMSREEAEAEAAWDPTEADPLQQQSYTFDNLYSLNDAVPDDVREELTRVGYGPPVCFPAVHIP